MINRCSPRRSSFPPTFRAFAALALWGVVAPAFSAEIHLDADLRDRLVALPPITGEPISHQTLADRVVVVTFFASWCPPCRAEFEHLNTVVSEFPRERLAVLAVNVFEAFDDGDAARMKRFLADTSPQFYVLEGDSDIRRAFGDVNRIPTLFVFDEAGRPLMNFVHKRGAVKRTATPEELRAAIAPALAQ